MLKSRSLNSNHRRVPCIIEYTKNSMNYRTKLASILLSPLQKEVMSLVVLVCVFVLLVCEQHYSKCYERLWIKCYGGVLGATVGIRSVPPPRPGQFPLDSYPLPIPPGQFPPRTIPLLDQIIISIIDPWTIFAVWWSDRGGLDFHHKRLSIHYPLGKIRVHIGVMVCFGQGGLQSLSVSSVIDISSNYLASCFMWFVWCCLLNFNYICKWSHSHNKIFFGKVYLWYISPQCLCFSSCWHPVWGGVSELCIYRGPSILYI